MNSGRVSAELLVQVEGQRGRAGHVDAVGGDGPDPLEGRARWRGRPARCVGSVGSTTVSPSGVTRGSPTSAMPGSAAMRSASAGMSSALEPGALQVGDDEQRGVEAGSEAVGQQVVRLALGLAAWGCRRRPGSRCSATAPGRPASAAASEPATRYGQGRAEMRWASRHQAVASAGLAARRRPTIRPASMRSPSSDSSAGSRVIAVATANSTTIEVPSPMEARKPTPVSTRAAIASDHGAAGEEDGGAGRAHGCGQRLRRWPARRCGSRGTGRR